MKLDPKEVLAVPWKVMELELQLLERIRHSAAVLIYESFSSDYIVDKLQAEAEAHKRHDELLDQRLGEIAAQIPKGDYDVIDLRDEQIIDLREQQGAPLTPASLEVGATHYRYKQTKE
jgi:hypothetical protein